MYICCIHKHLQICLLVLHENVCFRKEQFECFVFGSCLYFCCLVHGYVVVLSIRPLAAASDHSAEFVPEATDLNPGRPACSRSLVDDTVKFVLSADFSMLSCFVYVTS